MSAFGDAIFSAPVAVAAREALAGEPAWIVGGAVRDALLGQPVTDIDLAVPAGSEQSAARALARAFGGHAFELSSEYGTWRAVSPRERIHSDVAGLRGESIEADLRERDFTANAIAIPLDGGEPIDPLGGMADIEAGVLKAASAGAFGADPLRLLRAVRLSAQFGLSLDAGTADLARESAGRAAEPAGERQFAELRAIVGGPDPLGALELSDDLGITAAVLPELAALRGVAQTANHHLDVHGHTIEVLRRLLELEAGMAEFAGELAPAVEQLLSEPLADELDRRTALRFGALVHDMGKPATRGEHEGRVTFIGHDGEGAKIVAGLCRRLKTSRALNEHLADLTRHHLRLGFMVHERPLSRRRTYEYLAATEPVAADVTLLTVADRLSARGSGPIASDEMIEAHLELAREMLAEALEWHRSGGPRPPVTGGDLIGELGFEPGPAVGRVLEELRAASFAGEISGREPALERARALAADAG